MCPTGALWDSSLFPSSYGLICSNVQNMHARTLLFSHANILVTEEPSEPSSSHGWDHPEGLQHQSQPPHRLFYAWREVQGGCVHASLPVFVSVHLFLVFFLFWKRRQILLKKEHKFIHIRNNNNFNNGNNQAVSLDSNLSFLLKVLF